MTASCPWRSTGHGSSCLLNKFRNHYNLEISSAVNLDKLVLAGQSGLLSELVPRHIFLFTIDGMVVAC
jgi:hypothetical protein